MTQVADIAQQGDQHGIAFERGDRLAVGSKLYRGTFGFCQADESAGCHVGPPLV